MSKWKVLAGVVGVAVLSWLLWPGEANRSNPGLPDEKVAPESALRIVSTASEPTSAMLILLANSPGATRNTSPIVVRLLLRIRMSLNFVASISANMSVSSGSNR